MPVIQARTREQLRVDVGWNLGHPFVLIEADATGLVTTLITDDFPLGGSNEHRGKYLVFTSGTNDGSVRRITSSVVTDGQSTLVFHPAVAAVTADGDTAELWDESYNPESIHAFLNQAIMDSTGSTYDPIENITLHADGKTKRFDIPDNISMIQKLQFRSSITSQIIHECGGKFTESTDAELTQTVDSEDYKRGGSSLKLTTTAGDGSFISESISSLDISGYTHLEGWVKATTAIAAADFNICLDDATCTCDGNDKETLAVPAAVADTWTFFRIALANPESDTAIVSVGIEYNANSGTNTVRFDELRVVHTDEADWFDIDRALWSIDKPNRDLILKNGAVDLVGYALLKIIGGDKPALLTTDASTSEIDDTYIIQYATAMQLMHASGISTTDPSDKFKRGQFFMQLAERSKGSWDMLTNIRKVD